MFGAEKSSSSSLQAIHDELQAYQLAYTQLDNRHKELEATNEALRREITEKFETKFSKLNKEVEDQQL